MDDTNYDEDSTSGDDAHPPFTLTSRLAAAPPSSPNAELQATDGPHSAVHVDTCAVVSAPAAAAAPLSRDGAATNSTAHPAAAATDTPAPERASVGGQGNEMPWFIDANTPVMRQDAGVAVGEQKESALPVLSRCVAASPRCRHCCSRSRLRWLVGVRVPQCIAGRDWSHPSVFVFARLSSRRSQPHPPPRVGCIRQLTPQ